MMRLQISLISRTHLKGAKMIVIGILFKSYLTIYAKDSAMSRGGAQSIFMRINEIQGYAHRLFHPLTTFTTLVPASSPTLIIYTPFPSFCRLLICIVLSPFRSKCSCLRTSLPFMSTNKMEIFLSNSLFVRRYKISSNGFG